MSANLMRIFYDNITGDKLIEHGFRGSITPTTIEKDINTFTVLSERNLETFDVLELEYSAYEQDFLEGTLIGVDLITKEPIFSYPNPNEPSEPIVEPIPLSTQIESLEATFMYDSMMKDMAIGETNAAQAELMYQLMMNGVI